MIVVLGAFGRTGRATAAHLASLEQSPVRRVTSNAARTSDTAGHEVVRARLSDDLELGRALEGAHALFAMLPDDLRAESFRAERRAMAEAIARAIRREGVRRVVLLSSSAAALGEDGQNGFGADLAYLERLVRNATDAVTILRASYFQDNVTEVLWGAAQDGVYPNFFSSREAEIPTIAALDVGRFAARALLEPAPRAPETVDLLGPSYSVLDMARVAGELFGRSLSVVDIPAEQQEQVLSQWMSAEAARAMVETLRCLGSGRLVPQGQRTLYGQTRLEQVLRATRAAQGAQQVQP